VNVSLTFVFPSQSFVSRLCNIRLVREFINANIKTTSNTTNASRPAPLWLPPADYQWVADSPAEVSAKKLIREEDDVRTMDAEADHLWRSSRVHVPDSSTSTSTPGISFSSDKDH
jgi:hypothetical protein